MTAKGWIFSDYTLVRIMYIMLNELSLSHTRAAITIPPAFSCRRYAFRQRYVKNRSANLAVSPDIHVATPFLDQSSPA